MDENKKAEEVLRDIKARRVARGEDFDEAMMAPLRRAVGIVPNDVHAAIDLNDEIVPCEERPECALSWGELNRMRTGTFYVMKSWVPEWLWKITPRFAKPWLTRQVHGDLTRQYAEKGR